jgi:hypothetical protein
MGKQGRKGSLSLQGFEVQKGGHCESSSMLNALTYLGYGLDEADIVGGGGAPSFCFTNEGFPFIGGRNADMRERFLASSGIPSGAGIPKAGEDKWEPIIALVERGLPAQLRVDMRYLPYLYGGKYGPSYMSFGGHWVCLLGFDFDSREALVTDTALGGPFRVRLADLDKARHSTTRIYPPRGEYAWIEKKPSSWKLDPDGLAKRSLATVLGNYGEAASPVPRLGERDKAGPLLGLAGLTAFPGLLASIHTIVNKHILPAAYSYMASSIERNGTGGAAFRRLFRDFLVSRSADCADPSLRALCASLVRPTEEAMAAWSALAARFDEASAALGAAKGGARDAVLEKAEAESSASARKLFAAESTLRDAIAAALG